MVVKQFAIYDSKTKAFMRPFATLTKGEAIRGFDDLCNDGKSMCSTHPGDFTLYELGEFDDQTGNYKNLENNERVISALEVKKANDNMISSQAELDDVIVAKPKNKER